MPKSAVPVAEYVRMSTEQQQYSIVNQQAAIREYAIRRNFSVIRTYVDAGKSGVSIRHRNGLNQLLQDVICKRADYKAILVYDVSRWGRFQDTDEAAHYEFICKSAGVPIHYCAETFLNDGSLPSSIMKALKRTMAGELSRELSEKVFNGQRRISLLGFRVGGADLYGLRRMMISVDGRKRQVLARGEWKSIKTDRIVLVPGSRTEVRCVRQIFSMAVRDQKKPWEISKQLNKMGIKYLGGREWDRQAVWRLLRHPVYAGYNVWGRTSQRISQRQKACPRSQWIVRPGSFKPLVDEETFRRAQVLIEGRNIIHPKTDSELLVQLKRLLARKGRLSGKMISNETGMCDWKTYAAHFGSLPNAYKLVGYKLAPIVIKASNHCVRLRTLQKSILASLQELFPENVRLLTLPGKFKRIIEIHPQQIRVSLFLCREFRSQGGRRRWMLFTSPMERRNIGLVCILDACFEKVLGCYVMPAARNTIRNHKRLSENDPWFAGGRKLTDLSEFCVVVRDFAAASANSVTARKAQVQ